MDCFIQDGLYLSVLHHYCQAYIVKLKKDIIALFALSFDGSVRKPGCIPSPVSNITHTIWIA